MNKSQEKEVHSEFPKWNKVRTLFGNILRAARRTLGIEEPGTVEADDTDSLLLLQEKQEPEASIAAPQATKAAKPQMIEQPEFEEIQRTVTPEPVLAFQIITAYKKYELGRETAERIYRMSKAWKCSFMDAAEMIYEFEQAQNSECQKPIPIMK